LGVSLSIDQESGCGCGLCQAGWPGLGARREISRVGVANEAYEAGLKQRMVIIEWPSLQEAIAAHDSPEYQAALKVFNNAAERDFRILEAME
jgi:uncharacterized protein (DUF1330 family)